MIIQIISHVSHKLQLKEIIMLSFIKIKIEVNHL
jgi:hypothetical protein